MFIRKLVSFNKISFTISVLTNKPWVSSTYPFYLRNNLPNVGATVASSSTMKIPASIGPYEHLNF